MAAPHEVTSRPGAPDLGLRPRRPGHVRRRPQLIVAVAASAIVIAGGATFLNRGSTPTGGPVPRNADGTTVIGAAQTAPPDTAGTAEPPGRTWHVDAGAASTERTGGSDQPFTRLQQGIDAAQPGDTVLVAAGDYRGEFSTVRDGAQGQPITIRGEPGAVLHGPAIDEGRVLTVGHDWTVVSGLKITRGDKGIWVQEAANVTLRDNEIGPMGGECVRLKYFAVRNEIVGNRIGPCGLENFDLSEDRKNGEGVYIGTAPEQLSKNPTRDPDHSDYNRVHSNVVRTRAECVDIKESSERNVVERNRCSGSLDPEGSGLDSRGNNNVFRHNTVTDVRGKGVRLGGDTSNQGIRNDVYGNTLLRTGSYAIGAMRAPQGAVCGNTLGENRSGAVNADDLVPDAPCT